ncbi:MAG: hypothetical protein VX589_19135 [Myxococcota bacterium]|nr:hypothetical protein [Myxococcota bacterium]
MDVLQGGALGDQQDSANTFSRLALTAIGLVRLNTLIGAWEIGIGDGYGFYRYRGTGFEDEYGHGSELLLLMNYTAFLTDAIFARSYVEFTDQSMTLPKTKSRL